MTLTQTQVECYAGEKADESPRRFLWNNRWLDVSEILDRWHQIESLPEWPRADYFKVRASDGHDHLIKHDLEADTWYLGQRW